MTKRSNLLHQEWRIRFVRVSVRSLHVYALTDGFPPWLPIKHVFRASLSIDQGYTPFGRGLVTISHSKFAEQADAPQTLRLWSLENIYRSSHGRAGMSNSSSSSSSSSSTASFQAFSSYTFGGKNTGLTGHGACGRDRPHGSGGAVEVATPDMVCVFKGHVG